MHGVKFILAQTTSSTHISHIVAKVVIEFLEIVEESGGD